MTSLIEKQQLVWAIYTVCSIQGVKYYVCNLISMKKFQAALFSVIIKSTKIIFAQKQLCV